MQGSNPFVVGILGGMGSYSTLHFFEELLAAFPAEKEWERPRIVIDNHCVLPSRVRAILYGEGRQELVAGMAASIRGLLAYDPDVIAIPCNTAHCFLDEVRALLDTKDDRIVDMLEVVAAHCDREGLRDVFLLATEGTVATGLYEKYFAPHGVTVHNPSEAQLARIRGYIEDVKQRKPLDREGFRAFVESLPVAAVMLGCTELSSFYPLDSKIPLIDPVTLLIRRIREMAPP